MCEYTPIGTIVEFRRGLSWSSDQERRTPTDGRVPVLRIPNVKEELDTSDLIWLKSVTTSQAERFAASKGWILMVGSNGNPNRIGDSVLIDEDSEYLFASFLIGIKPNQNRVDPRYMRYRLQAADIRTLLQTTVRGSTGLQNINLRAIANYRIGLPRLTEQRRIADILDTLNDHIRATQRIIAKLRLSERGLLYDLMNYGLNELGAVRNPSQDPHCFQWTPVGLKPKTWRTGPLIEFSVLQRGFDITAAEQSTGPYPVVSSSGIKSYHDRFMVQGPGVITGRKGLLGDTYYIDGPYWPHDTSLWVKNFRGNDPRFIALLLKYLRLERFDAATSVPTLNRNVVHPIMVSVPQLAEQRRIVTAVNSFRERIRREESMLGKLTILRSGLMADLFSGRVRVPAEAAS